jgi:hypothetical protein
MTSVYDVNISNSCGRATCVCLWPILAINFLVPLVRYLYPVLSVYDNYDIAVVPGEP